MTQQHSSTRAAGPGASGCARMAAMLLAALVAVAPPAAAHHPGERIDEATAALEPAFEATDIRRAPALRLIAGDGAAIALSDLRAQIVVLSFVRGDCGIACQDQQAALLRVQEAVNVSAMRDRVTFLTVAAPGSADAAVGTSAAAATRDPANRQQAVPITGSVATAEATFRALIPRQTAAPLIHIIDRNGRHAGIFEGSAFDHVNLVLYISELANAPAEDPGVPERLRDRVLDIFE